VIAAGTYAGTVHQGLANSFLTAQNNQSRAALTVNPQAESADHNGG
jgi:hypothetical protein